MTAKPDLLHCAECGMPCEPGEYHPFAACLMFKASRNSTVVRANLRSVQRHATAARDAEIEALRAEVALRDSVIATHAADTREYQKRISQAEARADKLRAEVEMLRDAFSDEDMTAGAHWFGRYVEQKRRAEQLAGALRAERRWWVDRKADAIREQVGGLTRGDPGAIARCDSAIQRIDAALRDQEDRNG